MTLSAINEVVREVGKDNLAAYKKAAKERGLNGVAEPFWRKWFGADPSEFYVPDALHQWFKFFIDHVWKWSLALLGKEEMDKRLSVLQQVVGYRHFGRGVTRFKQHTGREQRDLMRYFVAVVAGHPQVSSDNLKAFRAYIDFAYIAQYKSHSTQTLQYLNNALDQFHEHLPSLSHLRSGKQMKGLFLIPKLELMHNVVRSAKLLGSSDQFNSEQVEKGHIIFAKVPYKATNKKDYASQMCRYTDRQERVRLFDEYLEWVKGAPISGKQGKEDDEEAKDRQTGPHEEEVVLDGDINDEDAQDSEDTDEDEDEDSDSSEDQLEGDSEDEDISEKMKRKEWRTTRHRLRALEFLMEKRRKRKTTDAFRLAKEPDSIYHGLEANRTTAFILTSRITHKGLSIGAMSKLYKLESLREGIIQYYKSSPKALGNLSFRKLDAWDHVRLQLHAARDSEAILPFQRVEAIPPNAQLPFGRCNFVLIKDYSGMEHNGVCGMCHSTSCVRVFNQTFTLSGHTVVQIRLIFRPVNNGDGIYGGPTLAYVEYFKHGPRTLSLQENGEKHHVPDDDIEMFRVIRKFGRDEKRIGGVIPLTDIWRPIQLIPVFGKKCPVTWDSDNAVELSKEFFVNSFWDKETYQAVY